MFNFCGPIGCLRERRAANRGPQPDIGAEGSEGEIARDPLSSTERKFRWGQ
jgi:hypothetical protein